MKKLVIADSKGVLNPDRSDIDSLMFTNPWKYRLAMATNGERISNKWIDPLLRHSGRKGNAS